MAPPRLSPRDCPHRPRPAPASAGASPLFSDQFKPFDDRAVDLWTRPPDLAQSGYRVSNETCP